MGNKWGENNIRFYFAGFDPVDVFRLFDEHFSFAGSPPVAKLFDLHSISRLSTNVSCVVRFLISCRGKIIDSLYSALVRPRSKKEALHTS